MTVPHLQRLLSIIAEDLCSTAARPIPRELVGRLIQVLNNRQ